MLRICLSSVAAALSVSGSHGGLKATADLVKAQKELDRPRIGRTARRAGLVETIADERHRLAESLANAPGLRWTSDPGQIGRTEPGQKPPKPMGEP